MTIDITDPWVKDLLADIPPMSAADWRAWLDAHATLPPEAP
jgi:hypothetical protein